MAQNNNKIKDSTADKIFYAIVYVILAIVLVIVIYPLYFVVVASFSDPVYVNSGEILLYPKGITFVGYQKILEDTRIWQGYLNTIIYTIGGTIFGLLVCIPAGYSLSRKDLPYRGVIMALLVFTMYFSGGLIPTYLVVHNIGLMGTRLLMIIMGTISVYNIILIRSFFGNSIPLELQESAEIDGCSNEKFFTSIALPLAKPIIAVIALYIAVAQWNAYFAPMIYLSDSSKYPLQLVLREILAQTNTGTEITDPEALEQLNTMAEVIKYGVIIVSSLPVICIYPLIQKYFVKGVMVGALKG
ncbi:carbohydrate ABC transporter permease [Candidatus Epulonipiscium viviparus]|uniref:carbohydrate ABC transporter permease n=1 Tax=Candidatus Epulonipiscium viviparus TaxID=420336 RepID=UPI00016C0A3B|nr:carbohydrate ABC transporter permease [Candidatus Epulopiscium viviparus]